MNDGSPFPSRDLIIFLTAGTILLTLIVANFALPILASQGDAAEEERALKQAQVAVLANTLEKLREVLKADEHAEYVPALRLVTARYRTRLYRERAEIDGCGDTMRQLMDEVFERQQARADEIQSRGNEGLSTRDAAPYYAMLRGIRASTGYVGSASKVGSRFGSVRGMLAMLWQRVFPTRVHDERTERIYYDTCLFAIDLERTAIEYLEGVAAQGEAPRAEVAKVLADEHRSISESLWGRINYGQKQPEDPDREIEHGAHDAMPEGMNRTFGEQFKQARKFADEADVRALSLELDEINRLYAEGRITKRQAHELRESVYLMQMTLGE